MPFDPHQFQLQTIFMDNPERKAFLIRKRIEYNRAKAIKKRKRILTQRQAERIERNRAITKYMHEAWWYKIHAKDQPVFNQFDDRDNYKRMFGHFRSARTMALMIYENNKTPNPLTNYANHFLDACKIYHLTQGNKIKEMLNKRKHKL